MEKSSGYKKKPDMQIIAEIKKDNIASINAFKRLHYIIWHEARKDT